MDILQHVEQQQLQIYVCGCCCLICCSTCLQVAALTDLQMKLRASHMLAQQPAAGMYCWMLNSSSGRWVSAPCAAVLPCCRLLHLPEQDLL